MKLKNGLYLLFIALPLIGGACGSLQAGAERSGATTGPADSNAAAAPSVPAAAARSFAAAETIPNLGGVYKLDDYKAGGAGPVNSLTVEEKDGGKIGVSFDATYLYQANGAETFHEASGGGDLVLRGNTATGAIVEEGRGDGQNCRLTITFALGRATVKSAPDCNFNVSLDGVYKKEKKQAARTAKNEAEALVAHVEFARLAEFVNDIDNHRPGEEFVVEAVPMIKTVESAGEAPPFKGLYWLSADGSKHVASSFYASPNLVKALRAYLESEPDHLRVECVLVEVSGAGEVYRSPFAVRVEAVDAAGNVLWAVADAKPKRVKIQY